MADDVTSELEAVSKMSELLKGLSEDGKRRALWYLADLAGLSSRAAQQPAAMPMPPQGHRPGSMPMGMANAPFVGSGRPPKPQAPTQ